jgi:hypothetical protein
MASLERWEVVLGVVGMSQRRNEIGKALEGLMEPKNLREIQGLDAVREAQAPSQTGQSKSPYLRGQVLLLNST